MEIPRLRRLTELAIRLLLIAIFVSSLCGVACDASPASHAQGASRSNIDGQELVGKLVPEFAEMKWVDGRQRTLKEFRGHPVLVRFWNRHCGMCKDTAPLLNELYEKYSSRGLIIIGVHHKKTNSPDTVEEVKSQASAWHMKFPIAIDNEWKTVNRFWMNENRSMTSATILVGTDGRILWVHPGGTIEKNSAEAKQLDQVISQSMLPKN